MSCMTAVHDFKGNHIKFARFVLLAVSEDAKTTNTSSNQRLISALEVQ